MRKTLQRSGMQVIGGQGGLVLYTVSFEEKKSSNLTPSVTHSNTELIQQQVLCRSTEETTCTYLAYWKLMYCEYFRLTMTMGSIGIKKEYYPSWGRWFTGQIGQRMSKNILKDAFNALVMDPQQDLKPFILLKSFTPCSYSTWTG